MLITVREAASRVGRNPETVRRWIRSGKLPSRKVGPRHLIEELDIATLFERADSLPLPDAWRLMSNGEPQPDWVKIVRRSRQGH